MTEPKDGGGTGDNTVVVGEVSATPGQSGVQIPVYLANDVTLRTIIVPLMVRSVDPGAFITAMRLNFSDRLPPKGPISEILFTSQFGPGTGTCKSAKPGGFAEIVFGDTLSHPVTSSPFGLMFSRAKIIGADLPPGADSTGSLIMTVDVTDTPGRFEIDTTCANPANHLLFHTTDNKAIVPDFTKSTITISD
jgi:hypothetical protein